MSGFIVGADRNQATMFPERLGDYVAEESAVRVIDVFADELDLASLGFKTTPADTGRPGYHPEVMLKLYIYGYLNRVSTRRVLEREAQRNVEVMWLTGRLAPDFKTIADFRRDSGAAIQKVCRQFVVLCRKLDLFKEAFVAIDGSKFKALNHRDRNFTKAKMKRRLQQIDESIARYLMQMESLDRQESALADDKSQRLSEKIEILKGEITKLKKHEAAMLAAPDQQLSLTDPDARSMTTRGTGVVDYNVQVADRGYFSNDEIKACEEANITTYLPKPRTSNKRTQGYYSKDDFIYRADDDEYECPAGERLVQHTTTTQNGLTIHRYWTNVCGQRALKDQCTPGKERRVSRWQHEEVIERLQRRLDENPDAMRVRRQTVEHPFGTIKGWTGPQHFKMKTLQHVSTEMSLHVLTYHLKRMISLFGVQGLIEEMQAA